MNQPVVEIVRLDGSVDQCRVLAQRQATVFSHDGADWGCLP